MIDLNHEARFLAFATKCLVLILAFTGCEKPQQDRTTDRGYQTLPETEMQRIPHAEDLAPLGLNTTLKGKMARMEELFNAIDRFLDDPEFHERVCENAREFHRLLGESRGLYPENLLRSDQPHFDQTIDQTIVNSRQLVDSLRANNGLAARAAFKRLEKQRQDAHAKLSY